MKYKHTLTLVVLLAILLVGCGMFDPDPTPTPTATVVRPPNTPTATAARPTVTPTRRPTQTVPPPTATALPPTATTAPTRTPAPSATPAPVLKLETILQGYTSVYAPGVFESIIADHEEWNQFPDDLTPFAGFIALEGCDLFGQSVYARPVDDAGWELFLVADCAGDQETVEWMQRHYIVAEVDPATFEAWVEAGYKTGKGLPIQIALAIE